MFRFNVDRASFHNGLFRGNRRNRNRRKIISGLFKIAGELSHKFKGSPEAIEDAASDAALWALTKLHRFDPDRPGADPSIFFSRIIYRAMSEHLGSQRARSRKVVLFSHLKDETKLYGEVEVGFDLMPHCTVRTREIAEAIEVRRIKKHGRAAAMEIRIRCVA